MNVIKYPNKILRQRALKITNILTDEIQQFIPEFIEAMLKNGGIGLSGNQVNKPLRIVAVKTEGGAKVFINPFVYWQSFKRDVAEEGCLSFPGVFGLIKRSVKIRLFYRDQKSKLKHLKAVGLMARILLHEIDHLNGVLFIDKMVKYSKGDDKVEKWKSQAEDDEI